MYILHSIAESQSILLLTDIPHPESLIVSLFTTCFDIVSESGKNTTGAEISKSVEYHLKNLLAAVVDEATLPQEATDIIISQFLRVDPKSAHEPRPKGKRPVERQDGKQGTLILKGYPPAYNMAKSICTTCPEKMTAQITQYFGTVIVDATSAVQGNGHAATSHRRLSDLEEPEDEAESLSDLRKAHRLLRELWRACPDVLLNVVPQIEAELSADSPSLRQLATETLGDIAAGIGIAGLAPLPHLDPAAYPLPSIEEEEEEEEENAPATAAKNPLLTPASPKPFATVHATAYQNFLGRRHDKSPPVRAAWATAVARILLTSAGGIGIHDGELQELLAGFAQMLRDHEERVRLAAIRSIPGFTYHKVVNVLGADGGMVKAGTVLSTLADRVTDRKYYVREEAILLLARIWGVSSRDIEEGREAAVAAVGDIPKRLLSAYFTNDAHIHALIDKVMYESLLPLSFPPIKVQMPRSDSQKQRAKEKERSAQEDSAAVDPDAVRVRRMLTLTRSLDARSRAVFFGMQKRQVQMSKAVTALLRACEEYNGGVVEEGTDEEKIKSQLSSYIDALSKPFPDPNKVAADLWKFAKLHNRRDYQLIRFAMGTEYDYRTMTKAIKELTKRIREGPTNTQSLMETLIPLLYRCALIVYNRSHVPAIMEVSRTDANGLADIAHEVLKEISAWNPEVLKSHIRALCTALEEHAPSASAPEEPGAADTLKACAGFARRYPSEVSQDRKFLTAMTNFALYSRSPRASKHAVSILMTVADRKEMYAQEILTKALKDCRYSSPHFLARLATISQMCLLAPAAATAEADAIRQIAVTDLLHQNHAPSSEADPNAWVEPIDTESAAKELALKILVNQCRSEDEKADGQEFAELIQPVFKILMTLITEDGEITPSRDTPAAQRNRLRLAAARFILKLCSHKRKCEEYVTPSMFSDIAMIIINPPIAVRTGLVNQLKKYLGQNRLNHRWFTPLFLLAFEPDVELKKATVSWLKSRVQFFARQQQAKPTDKKTHQNVMESLFARLLSLLAHHPDYPDKQTEDFDGELSDFSKYIIFYLISVATEDNLSLIFHIAQRVKQTRDSVTGSDEASEHLYVLSDLAQAVIRNYADLMPAHAKGINLLQTWPGQVSLPRSLFKSLPSHEAAQEIAEKNYLPEDVAVGLEKLVRSYIKATKGEGQHSTKRTIRPEKKRKSENLELGDEDEEGDERRATKKIRRTTSLAIRKTPKPKRKSSEVPSSEMPSRKSTRVSGANTISYAEADSDEDDAEMEENDRLASSPRQARRYSGLEAQSENDKGPVRHDAPTPEQAHVERENEEVQVHEDEDQADTEQGSDGEPSPSPLKEKSNAGGGRKGKAKGKKTTTTTTSKDEQSVRTTRPTRRTRA